MARLLPLCLSAALIPVAPALAQVGGVYIDSKGMLRHTSQLSQDQRLAVLRAEAVGQPGSKQLADGCSLRKVSLKRLERIVAESHRRKKPLPADVRYLAGLTRVQYVFFNPAERDVVIAGPAEGWKQLPSGEVVGRKSGRPVLHLEDLITALRFSFARQRAPFIGCSIDPTPEGLKNYAAYLRKLGGRMDRSRLRQIFGGMERAMGPQAVRVFGVDASSRFALTLVAADYRLKRIAMGHDPSPVKQVVNYLDLASRRGISRRQPQHRFWFLAEYDTIRHTPDRLAFEFVGQGVKVSAARVSPAGKAAKTAKTAPQAAPAAARFAKSFTKHYAPMATAIPVLAELQNVVGLSVAAELVAQRFFGEVSTEPGGGWKPSHLLDAKTCPLTKYAVPKTVPSLAAYRYGRGRKWLISVSGGVEFDPAKVAGKSFRKQDKQLAEVHTAAAAPKASSAWWWD
ncbi:MAG: DUF1598 domain-containing protein [Planctomycetaceae bacterium]